MKINQDFIKKIFNLEIKLKKHSDKIKLSKYEEQIPMYDIYSQRIYPIFKQNIHDRLLRSHYRFVNVEVYQWLQNLYDKYSDDKDTARRLKYNLDVMDNYDLDELIETSYKALYKYSPALGLLVSICKRNSFHPFISHLKPYYSKNELIKLGQNMGLIKREIDPEYLINQETHYKICKKISNKDVSFDEMKKHYEYIKQNNLISWICFYSWNGSFIYNRFLRNKKVRANRSPNMRRSLQENNFNEIFIKGLYEIVDKMRNSPALIDDYEVYRFVWNDSYLVNLKEGDIFVDNGFLSTTRDPFYTPGINQVFGLVLIKIKIPKNKKGVGLFIENFSLFPHEEEYLLPPYSKIKLISKNDNFKYYHTNPEFEKSINKKYEFELVDVDYDKFNQIHKIPIQKISESINQIENIILNGIDRINLIEQFIRIYTSNNKINLRLGKNKVYSFTYQWFDSTKISAYEKFYGNKQRDGILFSIWNDLGYPVLNIELGNEIIVNFINQKYFGESDELSCDDIELVYHFGRIFKYKHILIYHHFKSFAHLSDNYQKPNRIFLDMNLYNSTLYTYLKTGKKYLEHLNCKKYLTYNLGYNYLDKYFAKPIDEDLKNKLPSNVQKCKNIKDAFILIIEKYFYSYPKIISEMDSNITKSQFIIYNIYDRLVDSGLSEQIIPNFLYNSEDLIDDRLRLVFRQPVRRF